MEIDEFNIRYKYKITNIIIDLSFNKKWLFILKNINKKLMIIIKILLNEIAGPNNIDAGIIAKSNKK